MFYVLSGALVALGILVLGVLIVRLIRLLHRCARTASMVSASTHDQVGLLRARSAAVRVAIEQRRHRSCTEAV
ncbi:bacteriophage holin [Saccharomonospora sp. NPDC046836]|uniref:bacteriophage holin n=1 Tax=Saccharomonospora sp. NPDC046836 TaxID=3156921 RepID=UPI0033F10A74